MKIAKPSLLISLFAVCIFGCDQEPSPLLEGTLQSVWITDSPPGSNSSTWTQVKGGKIQMFEAFLTIEDESGAVQVIPKGQYRELILSARQ